MGSPAQELAEARFALPFFQHLPSHLPEYCQHKHSGQPIITLNRSDHYLGPFGSEASRALYDRLNQWLNGGRQPFPADDAANAAIGH